jgi:hypothetical protein
MEHTRTFEIPMRVTYALKDGRWEAQSVDYPHLYSLSEPINVKLLREAVTKRFGQSADVVSQEQDRKVVWVRIPGMELKVYHFTISDEGEYSFKQDEWR